MGNHFCLSLSSTLVSHGAIEKLLSSWPGSVALEWSEEDLHDFSACFSLHSVKDGKEIPLKERNSFFIVAEGSCEVQAIVPTLSKKTAHIREFICKKDKGDMVFLPSVKKLISESSTEDFLTKASEAGYRNDHEHKIPIVNIVDTISVKSVDSLKILMLDWKRYQNKFCRPRSATSKVDTKMLRVIMETNLTDYLTKLPFLSEIPYSKLQTLVRMCHYQVEHKGSVICREGEPGSEVSFVLNGEVIVEAKASQRVVDMFGSHGIAKEEDPNPSPHSFRSRRGSSVKLDKADIAYAHRFFFPPANECEYIDEFVSEREDIASTRSSAMSKDRRSTVRSPYMKRKFTSPGNIELAKLGAGDYFGAMSTITELPRSATVTAASKVLLATLSKSDFKSFMKISPVLGPSVERVAKGHMLLNLFQLKSPFLAQISINQAKRMGESCVIENYDPGSIIFSEGDNAGTFYFVYSGSLKVEKKDLEGRLYEAGHLYSGDYFGELSIIRGSLVHRLGSVTTTSPTILLFISGENMHKCFHDSPQMLAELVVRMRGRDAELIDLLNHKVSRNVFKKHLVEMHGEESLHFFDEATTFESTYKTMSKKEIIERAKTIIDRFLVANANETVNVSHEIFNKAQLLLRENQFTPGMFDDAIKEIYILMERDLFQRFKKSDTFSNLLVQIRSYDDLDKELLA